jgi:hypothetical protein
MIRVWLKPDWKQILGEKVAIVQIAGGNVVSYESPPNIRLTIIDHDSLQEEIPEVLDDLGYKYNDDEDFLSDLHDDVVHVIAKTGNEDIKSIIKDILKL